MEELTPQEFLFKRDRTFDDLKSAYGEEDAMCHDSGLSWDRVFDYMSDYAEVRTAEEAKELQKQCNVSMELLAQNQKLLEALEDALPYVKGAYECAFPDERENEAIAENIEELIKS